MSGLIGVLVFVLGIPTLAQGQTFVGTGQAVMEGDTIHLLRETGQIVRIELYGIDAPERGQPYGPEAVRAVRRAVLGVRIRAVAEGRDDAGRPLFVLEVGDRVLNHQLVRDGLAWWDRNRAPHADQFRRLERRAREDERGLWGQSDPVPPWDWRDRADGS